jgi:hypothetical protein
MIERFAAQAGCAHKYFQVFHDLSLPFEIIKGKRAQAVLKFTLRLPEITVIMYIESFFHHCDAKVTIYREFWKLRILMGYFISEIPATFAL